MLGHIVLAAASVSLTGLPRCAGNDTRTATLNSYVVFYGQRADVGVGYRVGSAGCSL
jgi:hypothetical protein